MESFQRLLLENKLWAQKHQEQDDLYFEEMSKGQNPDFLWIGCSDSRVPANEITNTHPGEMFVHRNIANLVVNTDLNLLSVLQYAVEQLQVKHIIVCGHYGCGGVKASLSHQSLGLMNKWLRNIKDIYRFHEDEFKAIPNEDDQLNLLCELNVMEQVQNLSKTSIIQRAWKNHQAPSLHGWIYGLKDGLIKPLCSMDCNSPIDPIYQFEFPEQEMGDI